MKAPQLTGLLSRGKRQRRRCGVCPAPHGSIGYVEYAYALQNKMNYALVKNLDGDFVAPDTKTFAAAAAGAQWDKAPGMS